MQTLHISSMSSFEPKQEDSVREEPGTILLLLIHTLSHVSQANPKTSSASEI